MSKIEIPEELYNSLRTVIRYQNILLLKEIANEMGWKYTDLKNKYLKNSNIQELIDYSNKQKNKKIKKAKKVKKEKEENIKLVILGDNEEEIECKIYKYMETEYYVNIKNNNVYDMDKQFVGRMIGRVINFDEEEI
jgi:hypothetical protein